MKKLPTNTEIYLSKDFSENTIIIEDGAEVFLFDDSGVIQKIIIGEGATLSYFGFFDEQEATQKTFVSAGKGSKLFCKNLVLTRTHQTHLKIHTIAKHDDVIMNTDIVTFGLGGKASVDGVFEIDPKIKNIKGYLDEDNIFLGKGAKIAAMPTLLVSSNDIEASHACKIHKISDQDLFYLRSRGISQKNATSLMIESYIFRIFGGIAQKNEKLFLSLKEQIFQQI